MHVITLDTESGTRIGFCLVRKLKNVKYLRKKILSGALKCSAVKPSLIIDPLQVIVAANKALLSKKSGKLVTKSLNAELLYNLSISKSISQSLSKYGVGDNDENVLIVVFDEKGEEDVFNAVKSEVEGEECEITELGKFSDIDLIKKTYKISDTELQISTLANSVISRIATKEFGSY